MQPEKMVLIGSLSVIFIPLLGLIVGFLLVVARLIKKSKDSAWRGEVVDKMHKTNQDMDSDRVNHYFTLVVKTETNTTLKVGVTQEAYNDYQLGDRIEKKAGELWPTKISK